MKKQIFLVATMALTIFTACKDEDKKEVIEAPASKTKKEIITAEVWNVDYTEYSTFLNDSVIDNEKEVINGKAHFLDNNTVITYMEGEPDDTASWNLNGNVLIIDSIPMEILVINDVKLTLEFKEEENIPEFGKMKFIMTSYLTR